MGHFHRGKLSYTVRHIYIYLCSQYFCSVIFLNTFSPVYAVCRIVRVIRQPRGNMLLVGVGGSGRQSLSRLSAYIISYSVFQIEVTRHYRLQEFREGTYACTVHSIHTYMKKHVYSITYIHTTVLCVLVNSWAKMKIRVKYMAHIGCCITTKSLIPDRYPKAVLPGGCR